jgi:rubredoxin/membrane protein CcdC involved in cytochrome C biogenesis
MTSQWECTVCGYVHSKANPPESCPVCGVDSIKFSAVEQAKVSLLKEMVETFQPHAVAAHFPNALLPTAFLFTIIAIFINPLSLGDATWYLLLALLPTIPATLITGLYEWKTRFEGKAATIFKRKVQLAFILMVLLLITVGLRYVLGDPLIDAGLWKWGFCGLLLAMLGCVTLLGHYGGKLVFSLMNRS